MPDEDPVVCACLTVAESEVLHAIRSGADSVESVGRYCEAGTGCKTCHPSIRVMLRDEARRQLARSEAPKSLRQLSLFDQLVDDTGGRRQAAPMGSHKRD